MSIKPLGPVILDVAGFVVTEEERDILQHPQVGGVILFRRNYDNPAQVRDLIRCMRNSNPHLLVVVDQEGGRVQRFQKGFTRLPPMGWLGEQALQHPEQALQTAADLGWLMAQELLAVGVDMSLAPVLDTHFAQNSVIGDRAFGCSPQAVATLAGGFIQGMHQAGMKAIGKHFPGHGSVKEDSHVALPVDEREFTHILQQDLIPFIQLMPQLAAVMPAHIVFPAVDALPVGISAHWLQGILRQQLGFTGVVVSDDLSMVGAAAAGSYLDRAQCALQAGCDAILVCNQPQEAIRVIEGLEAKGVVCNNALSALKPFACERPEKLHLHPRWQAIQAQLARYNG